MGELKGAYKGYDLWFYEKGEKTSQAVWQAVSKGKRPEIQDLRKTQKAIKELIDETINKPPTKVETHKGVDMMFNPKTGNYEAQIGSAKRKFDDLEKLRNWIDKQKK